MIATRFADAPAGVLTPGGPVVRPTAAGCTPPVARPRYAVVRTMTPFDLTGTAVAAPTAPIHGTGLPSVGTLPPFGTGVAVIGTDALQFHTDKQHTLGIHSPGRPQS